MRTPLALAKIISYPRLAKVFSGLHQQLTFPDPYGKVIDFNRFNLDAFHFPCYYITPSYFNLKIPLIVTAHDIQHEYYPVFFDKYELVKRRHYYRPSFERADLIISDSEYTKKTLMEKLQISGEKIVVAYCSCADEFQKITNRRLLDGIREKYSLPQNFMLYPAGTWPHKNHIRLIKAVAILKHRYSLEVNLVMTGLEQNYHSAVMKEINNFGLNRIVKFIKFVPFEDLPVIYSLAAIMVFPSLYEGFGIPLLEAMKTGLPVVCSNATAIPEIAGDAALYFNPEDENDIAEKVFTLMTNSELKSKLITNGYERAKLFPRKRFAEEIINAYGMAVRKQD